MKNLVACLIMTFTSGFISVNHAQTQSRLNGKELLLIDVKKIWDKAPHNAFTDLIRFQDNWFCVFREGADHVSPDGALRVITSADGENWEPAALISAPDMDLRDAKITITPENRLMLTGAGALHDKSVHSHQSLAWFSDDGFNWSEHFPIGDPDFWLWRTTWHKNKAYSMGYGCNNQRLLRLYSGTDGKNFTPLVEDLGVTDYPNETSIVFNGDTAFCLLRRDGERKTGLIGTALPPYEHWEWKNLGTRIGGPHMIQLPDGQFIAAVRLYNTENWHPARTSLCRIDVNNGKITEALTLPSGGDTSYPGMVWFNEILWVSYYSTHEEKTAVYLAKIKIQKYR